jgi:transcriptional regulator with XRE-family HTH domain
MTERETTFGFRLRAARLDAGLTQSQLASKSGIPKPTLSRYENDHVLPSLGTLRRLSDAIGVGESELLPGAPTFVESLLHELRERGIEIRSLDEALRVADLVADALAEMATQKQQARA